MKVASRSLCKPAGLSIGTMDKKYFKLGGGRSPSGGAGSGFLFYFRAIIRMTFL
ncbi:hypothetical protein ACTHRH_12735 [Paenibacillus sp. SAFN-117]